MKKLGLLFVVVIPLVFTVSCISKDVQTTETYYETEYRTESYIEIGNENKEYITPKWERYAPMYFSNLEWSKTGAESNLDGYEISTTQLSNSQIKLILTSDPQSSLWGILVINLTGIGPLSEPPPQSGLHVHKMVEGEVKYIPEPAEQKWLDDFNAIIRDPKHFLSFTRSDLHTGQDITINVTGVKEFAIITCTPPHWIVSSRPVVEKVQLIWSEGITKERQVPCQIEKQRAVIQTIKVPLWEALQTNPLAETESPYVTTETSQPVPSAKLIYSDDFSNPTSYWPEMSSEGCESYYKDGEFHVIVNKTNWAAWRYNQNAGRFGDFIIEADIRQVSGDENSEYGLIFRCQNDDNYYYFLISADGYYLAGIRTDGKWTPLRRWITSASIEKGFSSNHLKVVCKASQIDIYVNGNRLATVIDNSFVDGYIGGILYTPGSSAHGAFDNLKVYSVD